MSKEKKEKSRHRSGSRHESRDKDRDDVEIITPQPLITQPNEADTIRQLSAQVADLQSELQQQRQQRER